MRQRAFHFEVGTADDKTDEEQAFNEFSNLEKQTKVVDENRRRRYFESASDFRKRMNSQRFTTIRRARQDSWVQAYADVYEDEPSPFTDMFEQPGASSLFGSSEYVDGSTLGNEAPQFQGRQQYSNGKPAGNLPKMEQTLDLSDRSEHGVAGTVSAEEKQAPAEKDDLKAGLRKPVAARARPAGEEAAPRRTAGAPRDGVQQVVPSRPETRQAAAANKRAQASDASEFAVTQSSQGNPASRPDANPDAATDESLFTNQFDTSQVQGDTEGSNATRKPVTRPKGFAGGRGGGRSGRQGTPSKAKPPQMVGAGKG